MTADRRPRRGDARHRLRQVPIECAFERRLVDRLQDPAQSADVSSEIREQLRRPVGSVGEQASVEMRHRPHEVPAATAPIERGERITVRRADDARRRDAVLAKARQHPLLCLEQRPLLARVRDL